MLGAGDVAVAHKFYLAVSGFYDTVQHVAGTRQARQYYVADFYSREFFKRHAVPAALDKGEHTGSLWGDAYLAALCEQSARIFQQDFVGEGLSIH